MLEKARDGGYDSIRDYARLSLIVADKDKVPDVVRRLASRAEFELVRAKNRLDGDYDARESAGYRDYQVCRLFSSPVHCAPCCWK